jgi:hypothetical protein
MNRPIRISLVSTGLLASFLFVSGSHAAASDPPLAPEQTRQAEVRLWSFDFKTRTAFSALPISAKGGGTLASGDVDGDGVEDIIVGAGPGAEPYVNIFNGDGTKRGAFLAYEKTFRGGVHVAVGDTDRDGKGEIIVAPGAGREPSVKLFHEDGALVREVNAYSTSFRGGVHVAALDMNADGTSEIVTSPGPSGGPHVRIWNGDLTNLGMDFFAFDASMRDGITIASIRMKTGPMLIVAPESWSPPLVRRYTFTPTPTLIKEFYAFDPESRNGLVLGAVDIDGDGTEEILAARNGGTIPEVRIFDAYGTKTGAYLLHDPTYRGGLSLASYAGGRVMSMPHAPVVRGPLDIDMSIDVNLTRQRLTAYEHGRVARSFLISSGTYKYPTPVGTTEVRTKIPLMDYQWSYGRNHPDNYLIRNVKFNLRIFPHIYIHTAYWHNNFGRRMSHGCVNAHVTDAEWVYNWAATGTKVEVHY